MPFSSIQQRNSWLQQYVQPEVQRLNRQAPDPYWYAPGTQDYIQQDSSGMRNFLLGAGAVVGAGFIPIRGGQRVWDVYHRLAFQLEERSPRGVLRTFGGSQLLQSMARHPAKDMLIDLLPTQNAKAITRAAMAQQAQYYSKLTGRDMGEFGQLIFKQGKLFGKKLGQEAEELLLGNATLLRKQRGTLAASYVNSLGLPAAFTTERNIVIGAGSRASYWSRLASAYATDTLQKVNNLARDPFLGMLPDLEVKGLGHVDQIWQSIRGWKPLKSLGSHFRPFDFAVAPGPAHKMMGAFGAKLASRVALGAAAYTGASFVTKTLFDETPLQLVADMYVGARKVRAMVGDAIGATEANKTREQAAPGSTSIAAVAAIPTSFFLTGSAVAWARRAVAKDATIATWAAQTTHSILPAFAHKYAQYLPGSVSKILTKGRTMASAYGLRGAALGTLLVAPFIPRAVSGLLFGKESFDELSDIYAGRKDVAIRKGRWWEFGRTPFRGDRVDYYRPHWYALNKTGAREKSIWGDDDLNWFQKFYLKNFTYELEKRHYYDRPYPVSSPAFADFPVPFIRAPLMALGRMIKPSVYMHTEEWAKGEPGAAGTQYLGIPTSAGEDPGAGGLGPLAPQSPHSWRQIVAEEQYKLTEVIGLRGFVSESIRAGVTGSKNLFAGPVMEDAGRIGSARRAFWDTDIGGGMGTTEFVRRLLPAERIKPWERYNPIRNQMPDWLPGPEYYMDFLHGDPYAKIKMGEVRLPGKGYEVLHPEVLDEGYSDFWRFKILADVAPYSAQYKEYARKIRAQAEAHVLNEEQEREAREILHRANEIKARREFDEGPEEGLSVLDNYWRSLTRRLADNPIEYLIPFAPIHKFIGRENALEQYEREVIGGASKIALWTRPIEHFVKPAAYSLVRNLGFDFVPSELQHRRDIDEYFDRLEYVKYKKLEKLSIQEGDYATAKLFTKKAGETMFGLDKYSRNMQTIYRAMSPQERDFYEQFVNETDAAERTKILGMVPEDMADLYRAQWELKDAEREKRGVKYEEFQDREKEISEFFSKHALPNKDWTGWDPSVDLQDVKLKYVTNLGEDMHDYNLWESRQVQLSRKPQVQVAAQELEDAEGGLSYGEARERIQAILKTKGRLALPAAYSDDSDASNLTFDIRNDQSKKFQHMLRRGELSG